MPDLLNNPGRTSVIITRAIERVGKIGLLGLDDTRPTAQKEGIDRLADTFSRFASTHQTAFDSGMARASSSVDGSLIERQIDRAMSQVLGRAPGRNTESFFGALADAFPVDKKGTVAFKPARTAMIFNSYDGSNGSNGLAAAGLQGQISTEQAALHRQASIVAGDALQILKCLQPFNPKADADEVEALRALVEVEIKSLVDEFGRIDRPREDRVNALFISLLGANYDKPPAEREADPGHLAMLGVASLLDGSEDATTVADESQMANFELLRQYGIRLNDIWNGYAPEDGKLDFSSRLEQTSMMLPVIAEANDEFMAAMDAIGFGESERRSSAANFERSLQPFDDTEPIPDMTVHDLNQWFDRFASIESPGILADSGQFGLDYVADQAHSLFITLFHILLPIQQGTPGVSLLSRVLTHERVNWSLTDLLLQVKALADVADGISVANGVLSFNGR
jgi:hypothetical protein